MGWLNLVYIYLYQYLYLSFAVRPKVDYCRGFIDGDTCNIVAYVSLWVMELPVAIFSFFTFSALLYMALRCSAKISFIAPLVVAGYMVLYFTYIMAGPFGEGNLLFALSTCLFHGAIFLACLWLAKHLTNYSSRRQQTGAAE